MPIAIRSLKAMHAVAPALHGGVGGGGAGVDERCVRPDPGDADAEALGDLRTRAFHRRSFDHELSGPAT